MHWLRAPASLLVLLLAAGAVPGPGTAAVSTAAAATPLPGIGPGSAATATSPVLVGTFQPDASGGACAAWDGGCPRTALQPTATRGVWALTLTIPAGDWHWRVALDGDAADSIGVAPASTERTCGSS